MQFDSPQATLGEGNFPHILKSHVMTFSSFLYSLFASSKLLYQIIISQGCASVLQFYILTGN